MCEEATRFWIVMLKVMVMVLIARSYTVDLWETTSQEINQISNNSTGNGHLTP